MPKNSLGVQSVKEMFEMSKLVKKTSQKMKEDIKTLREETKTTEELLGPYYYPEEDLTYKGEYRKGKREGLGI